MRWEVWGFNWHMLALPFFKKIPGCPWLLSNSDKPYDSLTSDPPTTGRKANGCFFAVKVPSLFPQGILAVGPDSKFLKIL